MTRGALQAPGHWISWKSVIPAPTIRGKVYEKTLKTRGKVQNFVDLSVEKCYTYVADKIGGTVMLQRKIYRQIEDFYSKRPGKALMIAGARQVGKTYIVEEFCKARDESFVKLDFIEDPQLVSLFSGAKNADDIFVSNDDVNGNRYRAGDQRVECWFLERPRRQNLLLRL